MGLSLRLLATFFAKGYIAHDDHFTVIESSASFADEHDYRHWLPGSEYNRGAEGHSFFYLGLHYFYFKVCNAVGLQNPQIQMLWVRLGHALYSLLVIFLGFKITRRVSNDKDARLVALILAVLAILPNYSVRNLVEIVCIVPMLWATWLLIKHDKRSWTAVALAGLAGGIAMGIRYQTGIFVGGLGLVLLLQRQWLHAIWFGVIGLASFFLTQISDLFIWGEAFAELKAYVSYNQNYGDDYLVQPWYMYVVILAGFLVPPVSLMLLFGYARKWRTQLLLFLPTLLFIIVHSAIGNKQERFIFPILPFIVILGVIGWNEWVARSNWWRNRPKLHRGAWNFFWIINLIAGVGFALSYGKQNRVEAMYALYKQADYRSHFSDNASGEGSQPPLFYTGKWQDVRRTNKNTNPDDYLQMLSGIPKEESPNYLLFYGDKNFEQRLEVWQQRLPSLTPVETIEPSWFDKLLHTANPKNRYTRVHLYRFEEFDP